MATRHMNHIGPRLMYVHTLVLRYTLTDTHVNVNNTEAVCERSDF